MLKLLIKTQISMLIDRLLFKKTAKSGYGRFVAILMTVTVLSLALLAGIMCKAMLPAFAELGLEWLYHAMIAIMAVMMCVVGSIFMAKGVLFDAKDTELLLAMPIPQKYIVLSRMSSLLIFNIVYTAMVLAPGYIVFLIDGAPSLMTHVTYLLSLFGIPMLSMAVICIVAWLIGLVASRVKHKNLISSVLFIVLFVLYFIFCLNMGDYVLYLMQQGATIAAAIKKTIPMFYSFGAATGGSLGDLAIWILWCIVPFYAVYNLLSKTFKTITTTKRGGVRTKYISSELKATTPIMAMVKKELKYITSFQLYLLNSAIGAPLALIFAGAYIIKGPEIILMLAQDFAVTSYSFLVPALIVILLFCATMICSTASSLSLEGINFWILRSFPISTYDVLRAKIIANMVLGIPLLIASLVFALTLNISLAERLLIVVLPSLTQCFVSVFGMISNILFPRLDWVSPTSVIKQSTSVMLALLGTMGLLLAAGVLYGFMLSKFMSFTVFGVICCLVLCGAIYIMLRYLKGNGSRRVEML